MVWEEFLDRHLVPWTPEIGATGRRHVAGIKFRDELARIERLGSKPLNTILSRHWSWPAKH